MNRKALIQLVHIAKARLKMDDAEYRAWLRECTGKTSSKDMSDEKLSTFVDSLRESGILDTPAVKRMAGVGGHDRPTRKQLKAVDDYARELGMSGIDDKGLATFCRRITKMDSPRFLDKNGITKLLNGLSAWVKRKAEHQPKTEEK
jgi:hypothetical protein